MSQTMKNVAEVLLEQLANRGVKRIYGVVGDAILGFMDAIGKQTTIQFIAVKHESVAAMMASAEAKLTGNLAVCTATMGPGLGNLLNGLADAHMDKAPVLAITGQAPTKKIGTDFKQYIDQQEFIKPVAAYTTLLSHPDAVTDIVCKAVHTSLSKGAVTHISIPKDMFSFPTKASVKSEAKLVRSTPQVNANDLLEVQSILSSARQPMILAGVGAKGAEKLIQDLAAKWGAGILVSLGAKTYFANATDHLLGGIGQGGNPYADEVFKQADVVLLVGDTWWPEGYVPTEAKIVQIDLAQENIGKGIPVEIGVLGDAKETLTLLVNELANHSPNHEWIQTCVNAKQQWDTKNEEEGSKTGTPIFPARIVRAIENCVEDNAILSIDTGDVTVWMNRNFRPKDQTFLFSGKWRTMGFGLPGALAAKLVQPDKQVVAIVGDGGLEMTLADLLTAVRYNLNITIIIFNNHALQMEKDKMIVGGYLQEGVDLTNPNFVGIAEACGLKGFQVENDSDLESTISEALQHNGPALIDVTTAAVVHPETKS
ncbi:thiamine pyrophosphate-binding protein [Cytobacillus suaedae]|nr:thiamine pyrophosphate-binding protein [Cytobacillus suaedae]